MKNEQKNKHEKMEMPKKEKMEKIMKSEPEYKGKGNCANKMNYKGKMC